MPDAQRTDTGPGEIVGVSERPGLVQLLREHRVLSFDECDRLADVLTDVDAFCGAVGDPYEVCLEPRDNDSACGDCPGCRMYNAAFMRENPGL